MGLFSNKKTEQRGFIPSRWGEPDDPDTRTQDVVTHLNFEITRLMGITEQLQDLLVTIKKEKDLN